MVGANLLIAAGTLVTGASGLLNSVVGQMDAFAVTLAVGITVIFAGFLVATTEARVTEAASTEGGPGAASSLPRSAAARPPP